MGLISEATGFTSRPLGRTPSWVGQAVHVWYAVAVALRRLAAMAVAGVGAGRVRPMVHSRMKRQFPETQEMPCLFRCDLPTGTVVQNQPLTKYV